MTIHGHFVVWTCARFTTSQLKNRLILALEVRRRQLALNGREALIDLAQHLIRVQLVEHNRRLDFDDVRKGTCAMMTMANDSAFRLKPSALRSTPFRLAAVMSCLASFVAGVSS